MNIITNEMTYEYTESTNTKQNKHCTQFRHTCTKIHLTEKMTPLHTTEY